MRKAKSGSRWGVEVAAFGVLVFWLFSSGYAVPLYTKIVSCSDLGRLGTMEIDKYSEHKSKWVGGVEIQGQFKKEKDLVYHYIQSVNVLDDPTPLKYKDDSELTVPFVDTPPGGYKGSPFDYKVYYDEGEFPRFYDKPSTYMLDAKTEADKRLALYFETWLVCVCSESFGVEATKARDDSYKVAPLVGWNWGYNITYADDGDGVDELVDFTVTKEMFGWRHEPSLSWKNALGARYGAGPTEDFYRVELCECKSCVPEPATLGLMGIGVMLVFRSKKAK